MRLHSRTWWKISCKYANVYFREHCTVLLVSSIFKVNLRQKCVFLHFIGITTAMNMISSNLTEVSIMIFFETFSFCFSALQPINEIKSLTNWYKKPSSSRLQKNERYLEISDSGVLGLLLTAIIELSRQNNWQFCWYFSWRKSTGWKV